MNLQLLQQNSLHSQRYQESRKVWSEISEWNIDRGARKSPKQESRLSDDSFLHEGSIDPFGFNFDGNFKNSCFTRGSGRLLGLKSNRTRALLPLSPFTMRIEIYSSTFSQQDYDTRACEFAYPLYTDELCVVVKKAARIPSELLPLIIFDEYLWLTLAIAGIVIGIIWSAIRHFNNVLRRPQDLSHRINFYMESYNFTMHRAQQTEWQQYSQVVIDTWLLFLSIPMRRFTRVQNERLLVAAVCLVSMIFVSMYQSGLATVFLKPLYFKDITSLEQLDNSGQVIQVKYAGEHF